MLFRVLIAIIFSLVLCIQTPGITPKEKFKTAPVNSIIGDTSFVVRFGRLPDAFTDEDLRIKTHLAYVEKVLREKDTSSLPQHLKDARARNIKLLHEYWTNGIFPRNYDYPGQRKPCFIDRDGRICAAGYLVEKTVGREIAERINAQYQYAYIYEMRLPELEEWIARSGLTKKEVATIQGTYSHLYDHLEIPPPPQAKASLVIITNAPYAEVIVNNILKYKTNEKGVIPTPINTKATKATIIVRHPDFHELSETVSLKIGKTLSVPINLISKYGIMVLDGLPQEAKIFIDGAEQPGKRETVEETGAGIDKKLKIEKALFAHIPTGEHILKILHPDYLDWESVLDVKPGEAKENFLAPPLKLAVAQLKVKPEDGAKAALAWAKVYLDDKEAGQVTPDGILVIENIRYKRNEEYTIRVVKNGFLEWKKKVSLAIGQNEIEVKLLPIEDIEKK